MKPQTVEDLKPIDERITFQKCALCPKPDDRGVALDSGPGGYGYAIGELLRLRQPDLANLFTRNTGGRTLNFLKKNALEQAIELIGDEIHRQYILTFEPPRTDPDKFHIIRVEVNGQPQLQVKTRAGYWPLP